MYPASKILKTDPSLVVTCKTNFKKCVRLIISNYGNNVGKLALDKTV